MTLTGQQIDAPPLTPEMQEALRAPFDPSQIGQLPKGGVMLDYVGHGAVRDRLLKVDPFWSWEPMALDDRGLPALDEFGNLWIRLTIGGVTRPGVGDGSSMKERIDDALRNAAMSFGVALDLWIRGHGDDESKPEQSRRPVRGQADAGFLGTFNALTSDHQKQVMAWLRERGAKPNAVPADLLDEAKTYAASLGDGAEPVVNNDAEALAERAQKMAERTRPPKGPADLAAGGGE